MRKFFVGSDTPRFHTDETGDIVLGFSAHKHTSVGSNVEYQEFTIGLLFRRPRRTDYRQHQFTIYGRRLEIYDEHKKSNQLKHHI
jgi:hypothetical protein